MSKLSVETEYDKAITALARSFAVCYDAKCKGSKCLVCPTKQQQDNVYNSMSDIDKLRVQYETGVLISANHPPKIHRTWAMLGALWDCRGSIFVVLLTLFLIFFIPYIVYSDTLPNSDIQTVLRYTAWNVHDINQDDKLNCIDYAIVFKHQWDLRYNPDDCELVRNLSPKLNHLFVRVKVKDVWEYVEPSAYFYNYNDRYTMSEFWGDQYDSRYNFYNETEYWMRYDKSNW